MTIFCKICKEHDLTHRDAERDFHVEDYLGKFTAHICQKAGVAKILEVCDSLS